MNIQKIDQHLQTQLRVAPPVDDTVRVIVRHRTDVFFSQALDEVKPFRLFNATAMRIRQADLEAMSDDDLIEYIWPDYPMHTCLDSSIPAMNVPALWEQGLRGQGIKLAVLDTGIDPSHPDFTSRIIARASFIDGREDDDNGHGTHVASIAAGDGQASQGKYRGVAPQANLYIAKVLDETGDGSMSSVMAGIEWAVEQGVQVINLSLGGGPSSDGSDPLSILCDVAVRERGVVVCVAAGNTGPGDQTIGSPGCAREVMTVGGAWDDDRVANFSSRGPTADGRTKPDFLLPGVGIIAAQAAGTEAGEIVAPNYVSLQGTSMATSHAAGLVCLLLEANPDLTPAQIKQIFQRSSEDLGLSVNMQGLGRLNAQAALEKVSAEKVAAVPPTSLSNPERMANPQPQPQPAASNTTSELAGCLARLFGR